MVGPAAAQPVAVRLQAVVGSGEVARWHVLDADTHDHVGWIGVVGRDGDAVVVGYEIGNEHRNRGYATAALRAVLEATPEAVHAETQSDHLASRRVMEKAGMRFVDVVGTTVRYSYDIPSAP